MYLGVISYEIFFSNILCGNTSKKRDREVKPCFFALQEPGS